MYVDGVFYPSPYDPASTIRNELDEIIEAQNDGFADFWNRDDTPHRIKFVPRNTEGNPNSYILREENTNQSFMELPDGSLVFCLAAKPCVPTSISLSIPNDVFAIPFTGKHYLTWIETIAGVSRTVTSSVNYPPSNGNSWTYSYHLTNALLAQYVKPGNPFNNGNETEILCLFSVMQDEGSNRFTGLNAQRGSKPITIQVIPTPSNVLGSGIDCYQFFINPDDGSAPEPVHSCGWDVIGYKVNNPT